MYINIYFLDDSHFPILIYQTTSDFSLFNKRILYRWKIFTSDHRKRRKSRAILTAGEKCTLRMKVTSE